MTADRAFFAPGKLVLAGEFGVIDGGPALVAAITHGVGCVWRPGENRISTPGDDTFVQAALAEVEAPDGNYRFLDAIENDDAHKIGVGGSAAATTVAVLTALTLQGRAPSPAILFEIASRVHHRIQGSGSGVDVAAACWGGVILYQQGKAQRADSPDFVVVWTGKSAKTGPRIDAYKSLSSSVRSQFLANSTAMVEQFNKNPIQMTHESNKLLTEVAQLAGFPYLTDELRRIDTVARQFGGAAKPSGAGGGDCAVVFFNDPEAQASFIETVETESGLTVISTELSNGAHER